MKAWLVGIGSALFAALSLAQSQPGPTVYGRGRGGAPFAWNDRNKDGICDLTGRPVGQGRPAGWGASVPGAGWAGRGGWTGRGWAGRGFRAGRGGCRLQSAAPAATAKAEDRPKQ